MSIWSYLFYIYFSCIFVLFVINVLALSDKKFRSLKYEFQRIVLWKISIANFLYHSKLYLWFTFLFIFVHNLCIMNTYYIFVYVFVSLLKLKQNPNESFEKLTRFIPTLFSVSFDFRLHKPQRILQF